MMKYSICIAAYKEPRISDCLKQLLNEGLKSSEVIVATPDEATAKLVKEFKQVKLIKEQKREGKPAAINKCLSNAKGEVIIITDADMTIKKGSLKELVKHFKDKKVGVVCGRPVITNKCDNMLGFWGKLLYDVAHKRRMKGAQHVTMNLCAFRKDLIKQIPRQALVDDYIIGVKNKEAGLRFIYEPKAIVKVTFPKTINDFLKQRARTFAGYMQVKDWYGEDERSFSKEVKEAGSVFKYPKGFKEWIWLSLLFCFRALAWLMAWYKYRLKGEGLIDIWQMAESTKD